MAAFAPVAGLAIAGEPAAASGGGPGTAQGTSRALGLAIARLAMRGGAGLAARAEAAGQARAGGNARSPLTWWASRRQKSYLGR
ncbi:MAG: hypothetical protein ACREFO_19155 [Acetobacteraceae bacterium]